MRRLLLLLIVLPSLLLADGGEQRRGLLLSLQGAIGPASNDYLQRGLERAREMRAEVVVLRMDTPGGLDTSMRDMIQAILASPVPVIGYVSPSGARAASAGTYLLYATHVAAMAPATNLGAATPVSLSPPGTDQAPEAMKKPPDPRQQKAINDAVAYIQGLARLRGRNAEWAERAVREAASLEAEKALEAGVIDLIAEDIPGLLSAVDGRTVRLQTTERPLQTTGIVLEHYEPDWRNKLLSVITDPNVAYILMLIGIYGLIFEFANPGGMVPGITGAICLLLALFAFQLLPINYAGVALILLGVALMVAEAFVPSFGALGIGGVAAFVIGSLILIDTEVPGYGISLPLIGAFALISAGLFLIVIGIAVKARRRKVVSGAEQLQGMEAEVLEDFDSRGRVRVHGETWLAHTDAPLKRGQRVMVRGVEGLELQLDATTAREDR